MHAYMKSILLFIMSIVLTACSLSPVKRPNMAYYQLNARYMPVSTRQPSHGNTDATLFVSRPVANAGYDTHAMIYIVKPYQLRSYANNQWVDSPTNMFLDVLIDRLQQSDYFHAVTFPPSWTHTDYQLNTHIITFQQEFLAPESQFHFVLQATLIDNRTKRVIATRRFESIVAAPENDPYSGVNAANVAANKISLQLKDFCINAIH